jgi:hypothetical protein
VHIWGGHPMVARALAGEHSSMCNMSDLPFFQHVWMVLGVLVWSCIVYAAGYRNAH